MKGVVLCLLVALAACETINYVPGLSLTKTYEYSYEGHVTVGRRVTDLAESGARIKCVFKIIGISEDIFALKVSNVVFEEFNGVPGKSAFSTSAKLTERLGAELSKSFEFEYANGHVGTIHAPPEISDTVVNIVRGILGFLQVTIKGNQRVYELMEPGIHGVCQSNYAIEEDVSKKQLAVTQVVDISNCQEKAAMYTGMALAVEDELSKKRGDNVLTMVKYNYVVKSTGDGAVITEAYALEQQYFSTFNVKGGNSKLEATRKIELIRELDSTEAVQRVALQGKGGLMYKFGSDLRQTPVLLTRLDNPVPKIVELIQRLTKANIYRVDGTTTTDVLELIQLLRVTTLDDLEALWKQLSGSDEHRRWLLDTVPEVADERVIKFLINRFKAGAITSNEAGQALLVTLNHLTVEPHLVEMSKEFLILPFSKSTKILWHIVALSYGSLVHRLCAYVEQCPLSAVQPLLDMASVGLTKNIMEDMVVALKALGNAGHPASIKTIIKFLPGFSPSADNLPTRVHSAAVLSLRHLVLREPHKVQDIALSVFVQRTLPAEIRMLACMMLFETKPPLSMVSTVTAILMEETDLQVASFAFSLLRGLAKSHTPDNHVLSSACNVAMKILEPKFGRLGFFNSRAVYLDWFRDDLLVGSSAEAYMLWGTEDTMPTAFMTGGKLNFIGRILPFPNVGVRAEGLKELFSEISRTIDESGVPDLQAITRVLRNLQSTPKDQPLLSVFARCFGQEVFFADLNRDIIQAIIKAFHGAAGKESPVWKIIEEIQRGLGWHWTKPFVLYETRFVQATCLGLPVEISKYFNVVTGITINAKANINPPLKEHLIELLDSEIALDTDGYIGYSKDIFVFHGINTNLFQCGTEIKTNMIANVPWKFAAKMNMKENKFIMNFSPLKQGTDLFSFVFDVYAVSRNAEEPSMAKMTPMVPVPSKEQTPVSEVYHPKTRVCAEAKLYGMALCIEAEAKRVHYVTEYPLSYVLGFTRYVCRLEPVKPEKTLERVEMHLKFTRKRLLDLDHMINILQRALKSAHRMWSGGVAKLSVNGTIPQIFDTAPDHMFMMKALAILTGLKPEGYEGTLYYVPAPQKEGIELIVSQVGEEANWKMCMDANVDNAQREAKAHFRWGAECQTYEVTMKATSTEVPGAKTSIYAKINWENVPKFLKILGKSVEEYIPGVSFLLGFRQRHERNVERQVSATACGSSVDGFDVRVKMPELTIFRETMPYPFLNVDFAERNNSLVTDATGGDAN